MWRFNQDDLTSNNGFLKMYFLEIKSKCAFYIIFYCLCLHLKCFSSNLELNVTATVYSIGWILLNNIYTEAVTKICIFLLFNMDVNGGALSPLSEFIQITKQQIDGKTFLINVHISTYFYSNYSVIRMLIFLNAA